MSSWIHDEGVKLKSYLLAAGRWEALEWDRIHAWIDAVVLHHATAPVADPAPTPAETVAAATDHPTGDGQSAAGDPVPSGPTP